MCTKHFAVLFRFQFLRICQLSMRSQSARFTVSVRFQKIYINAPVMNPGFPRGNIHLPNYRPHRSCGKVMFLHLSVILSTGGVYPSMHLGRHPPADTPPGRHPPPADGYCSRRYASYWNAFLFSYFKQYDE